MEEREEQDAMGAVRVPAEAYYGAQTRRALDSALAGVQIPMPRELIHALARVKLAAVEANRTLGLIDPGRAEAIAAAAREVLSGALDGQFVLGVFQTGSGTSTNMNMNEVLAGRANEILTGRRGGKHPVHPNDHVNLGQSSNDVIPTAIHLAAALALRERLVPALERLRASLAQKAVEFAAVRKIGRTHLQDAVPMRLGQEFGGYARQAALGLERLAAVSPRLAELALGGTAVGTGVNTHPEFARLAIGALARETGIGFVRAADPFEAQACRDAAVELSGALRTVAVSLSKIANDLRWLASGPRGGLGEIVLPALQPGSSIMPGKVNPVIPEAVLQAAAQVIGNDAAVAQGGLGGNFELNTMMPLIAHNLIQSINLLAAAAAALDARCVRGIVADRKACEAAIERSLALATGLVPAIGYDRAAAVAQKAHASGRTVRETVREEGLLTEEEIERLLTL